MLNCLIRGISRFHKSLKPYKSVIPVSPTQAALIITALAPQDLHKLGSYNGTVRQGFLGQIAIITAINLLTHGFRSAEVFPKNMGFQRPFTKKEHLALPKIADFLFEKKPQIPFSISSLSNIPQKQAQSLIEIIADDSFSVGFRLREQKTDHPRHSKFNHRHFMGSAIFCMVCLVARLMLAQIFTSRRPLESHNPIFVFQRGKILLPFTYKNFNTIMIRACKVFGWDIIRTHNFKMGAITYT